MTDPGAGSLPGMLEAAAAERGSSVALIHNETETTFTELLGRARQLATLCGEATREEESIAVIGDNHVDWVASYYGIPASGRRLCFLNHRLAPAELEVQLERARVGLVIGSASELRRLPASRAQLTFGEPLGFSTMPLSEAAEIDGAWLLFTSGTTGRPKGALLSSATVLAACASSNDARPIGADEVFAFPFPLCHVAGYNVVRHHVEGRPVVLLDRFDALELIAAIERHQVTSVSLASTMLTGFLDAIDQTRSLDAVRSLRTIAYGAAPMPAALLRRTDATLEVDLTQGYGMTELSGNAVFLDAADHRRGLDKDPSVLTAAGRPGPGVAIRVVSSDDGSEVDPGAVGEVTVSGPQVMLGYLDDEAATASTIVDGWLRTGDLGRIRSDGLLEIVDRLKDMIITGGENVASLEVEDAIGSCCPELAMLAVVGVPDERWGQNVCCCATLAPGGSMHLDELARRLNGQLASYKIPRHLVIMDELPLTASGKVAKGELRQLLADSPSLLGPRRGSTPPT